MDLVSQRKQSTLFKILVVVARLFALCASSSSELSACLFAQEINVYATFVLEINCTNTTFALEINTTGESLLWKLTCTDTACIRNRHEQRIFVLEMDMNRDCLY